MRVMAVMTQESLRSLANCFWLFVLVGKHYTWFWTNIPSKRFPVFSLSHHLHRVRELELDVNIIHLKTWNHGPIPSLDGSNISFIQTTLQERSLHEPISVNSCLNSKKNVLRLLMPTLVLPFRTLLVFLRALIHKMCHKHHSPLQSVWKSQGISSSVAFGCNSGCFKSFHLISQFSQLHPKQWGQTPLLRTWSSDMTSKMFSMLLTL